MAFRRSSIAVLALVLFAAFAASSEAATPTYTGSKCTKFGLCSKCTSTKCLACYSNAKFNSKKTCAKVATAAKKLTGSKCAKFGLCGECTTTKCTKCYLNAKLTSKKICAKIVVAAAPPLLTGAKCNKFPLCSKCTTKACVACKLGSGMNAKKVCACNRGLKLDAKKGCVATGLPPPVAQDKPVADPKLSAAKSLTKACTVTTAGKKFTVAKGLYAFKDAAKACKALKMKLPDIDAIYAGNSAALLNAATAAVNKCVGANKGVWFDTALAAPQCDAFVAASQPTAGLTTGRKLSAAVPTVLLTQNVPTGCTTKLPVLCM